VARTAVIVSACINNGWIAKYFLPVQGTPNTPSARADANHTKVFHGEPRSQTRDRAVFARLTVF
jgi:hypothetical protein